MIEGIMIFCSIATIGLLCNVCAWIYNHFLQTDSTLESVETTEEQVSMPQELSTEEIVNVSLRELQCVTLANDNKKDIEFEYQSEFFIIQCDSTRYVHLFDVSWYSFPAIDIDQFAKVKRIINEVNWNAEVTLSYSRKKDTIQIHSTHSLLCVDTMDFTNYLRHILRECFIVHSQFFNRLSTSTN